MNHIQNIEIKNFKSIRHQKIEDCRRINVFIGYPNVGKSNILEALSLFSVDKIGTNFNDFVRIEKLTTFFFDGYIENNVEVIINSISRIVGKYVGGMLKVKNEYDKENYGFENVNKSQPSVIRKEVSEICAYSVEDLGKVTGFKSLNGIKLDNENRVAEVLKYDFKKNIKFTTGSGWSFSHPFGENIFSVISENRLIKNEVEEIFSPNNLELLFDSREQVFTILKRTKAGIFTIPYELIADTIQRLIFYKTAILSNKDKVLLFEEPEAHMFPPYIKKFTSDVIFDETNQFFIATHSPYVLSEFIEEAAEDLAVYVVDYNKGETVIKRLTENELLEVAQYGVDLFFNLESYLDKNVQPHSA